MTEQAFTYRAYSITGDLLYIGMTRSPAQRIRTHQLTRLWARGDDVTWVITCHDTVTDARHSERNMIKGEQPRWNVQMNRRETPRESGQIRHIA